MELTTDGDYLTRNFRLVKARELMGLSQSEVARQVGIFHATYFTYERMKNEPQQERKIKIAQILGQPVEYLFPEKIKKHYATRTKSKDIYDNCEKVSFDFEAVPQETDMDQQIDEKRLKVVTDKLLKELKPRQREILELHYRDYTLEEIGKMYKLTRERIRQIEAKALKRLNHPPRLRLLEGFL